MKADGPLSQSEAQALWSRAAELEEASRQRAQREANEKIPASEDSDSNPLTISAEIARQAAIESGIEPRYVDAAQLELGVEHHLDDADRRTEAGKRGGAGRALRFNERNATERAVLQATPDQVRVASMAVLSGENFASELVEIMDPSPERMALVYEVPANLKSMIQQGSFHYEIRQRAEIQRFAVLITRVDDSRTEVVVYALLDRSLRVNATAMRAIQGLAGTVTAASGGFGGWVLAGVLGAAGIAAGMASGVGAAALGLGAVAGIGAAFRSAYRKAYGSTRESFRRLLTAIKASISTDRP